MLHRPGTTEASTHGEIGTAGDAATHARMMPSPQTSGPREFHFGVQWAQLLRRMLWSSAGTLILRARGLITLPVALIVVGRGGYGTLTVVSTTATLLVPVLLLNIPDGAALMIIGAPDAEIALERIARVRRLGVIVAGATFVAGGTIGLLLGSSLVLWTSALASVIVLFKTSTVHLEYFQQIRRLMRFQISAEYAAALGLVPAIWLGLDGLFAVYVLAMGVAACLAWRTLHPAPAARSRSAEPFWRPALGLSLPLLPAAVSQWALLALDALLVYYMRGARAEGSYSAAYSLASGALFLPVAMAVVWIPSAQRVLALPGEQARRYLGGLAAATAVAGIAILAANIALAQPVAALLIRHDYGDVVICVPPIVLGFTALALARVGEGVLYARARTRMILLCYVAAALVNLVANLAWIPHRGLLGAAYATALGYIVLFASTALLGWREFRKATG